MALSRLLHRLRTRQSWVRRLVAGQPLLRRTSVGARLAAAPSAGGSGRRIITARMQPDPQVSPELAALLPEPVPYEPLPAFVAELPAVPPASPAAAPRMPAPPAARSAPAMAAGSIPAPAQPDPVQEVQASAPVAPAAPESPAAQPPTRQRGMRGRVVELPVAPNVAASLAAAAGERPAQRPPLAEQTSTPVPAAPQPPQPAGGLPQQPEPAPAMERTPQEWARLLFEATNPQVPVAAPPAPPAQGVPQVSGPARRRVASLPAQQPVPTVADPGIAEKPSQLAPSLLPTVPAQAEYADLLPLDPQPDTLPESDEPPALAVPDHESPLVFPQAIPAERMLEQQGEAGSSAGSVPQTRPGVVSEAARVVAEQPAVRPQPATTAVPPSERQPGQADSPAPVPETAQHQPERSAQSIAHEPASGPASAAATPAANLSAPDRAPDTVVEPLQPVYQPDQPVQQSAAPGQQAEQPASRAQPASRTPTQRAWGQRPPGAVAPTVEARLSDALFVEMPQRDPQEWARLLFQATTPQRPGQPAAPRAGQPGVRPAAPGQPATQRMPAAAPDPAQPSEAVALPDAEPLRETTRRFLEPLVGIDPAEVRIYRGAAAAEVTRELGVEGVSVGDLIALGPGHNDETRPETLGLLAHELAHTARRRFVQALPPAAAALGSPSTAEETIARTVEQHAVRAARHAPAATPAPVPVAPVRPAAPSDPRWGGLPAPWEPMPTWFDSAVGQSTPAPQAATMVAGYAAPASSEPGAGRSSTAPARSVATSAAPAPAAAAQFAEMPADTSQPAQAAPQHAEQQEQAAPDLDALARQVYDVLKKRLAAERRRLG